ncbi:ABC transporter ATP-binding protein [Aquiflexum sp. LQ15W]|uniref:ABC transporter ATP-binding protein n=1 Tax=Cognataquiflexum nitidum TaxID=2922272 RepID=UPI001F133A1F|nr:ABC transporter ATP-binding protein [Cognataquiflexum nitidum]MCH6201143.1 ABC transporter ATP-binding protein [Cognataquiflexum nitidum]
MELKLSQVSKRYQYDWIFKDIDLHIPSLSHWAITGSNGSGKSTLLKCLSGVNPLTKGTIQYFDQEKEIKSESIFNSIVITAPYMELPEEFTLIELLQFHFKFKRPVDNLTLDEMMDILYLKTHRNKTVSQFSSGMKQRLKLGLCFFSESKLVFLDEPTSNLDKQGVDWYLQLVKQFSKNKTLFVCSNDPKEYGFCPNEIKIEDFKHKQKL